jgi:DNA-binding NtrC family response regulator
MVSSFERFIPGNPIAPVTPMDLQIKVLIVEDDQAMAQMCAKLIRRRGHTAQIAESSHQALAILRGANDIDIVISDVQMPQMSGIQLLARLRALHVTIPIILMTGYTQILNASQALDLGASDYIVKPFDADALLGTLERATGR